MSDGVLIILIICATIIIMCALGSITNDKK